MPLAGCGIRDRPLQAPELHATLFTLPSGDLRFVLDPREGNSVEGCIRKVLDSICVEAIHSQHRQVGAVIDVGGPDVEFDHGRACLIITGPPGAGKSSVARPVAERLRRSALLDGDAINALIVSGFVWALGEPAEEAARQVRLLHANLCCLAANFADAAITPVIDAVIPNGDRLNFFLDALAPRPVLLVVLAPSADVCRTRNAGRPPETQFFFDGHQELMEAMREDFGTIGWWLNSSALSLEETVQLVTLMAYRQAHVHRPSRTSDTGAELVNNPQPPGQPTPG